MNVTMLLADAAQVIDNKLYILGGGWSITGPAPAAMALAVKIEVPWSAANCLHALHFVLVDQDGAPVCIETPEGARRIEIQSTFEVGRPSGLPVGTPLDIALAITVGPVALPPGGRYAWQCLIDGEVKEAVSFSTRPLPPAPCITIPS